MVWIEFLLKKIWSKFSNVIIKSKSCNASHIQGSVVPVCQTDHIISIITFWVGIFREGACLLWYLYLFYSVLVFRYMSLWILLFFIFLCTQPRIKHEGVLLCWKDSLKCLISYLFIFKWNEFVWLNVWIETFGIDLSSLHGKLMHDRLECFSYFLLLLVTFIATCY